MKLLIVLSNFLLREGLREMLIREGIAGEIVTAHNLWEVEGYQPDAIMVDAHNLAAHFGTRWPEAKILLIDTGLATDQLINLLLTFNLEGIIDTHTDITSLNKALHAIDAGQVWVNNGKMKAILSQAESLTDKQQSDSLSKKEREIVLLICKGLRNREIAANLSICEPTVKTHIRRIFRKCNVSSRSQLFPFAISLTIEQNK